MHMQYHTAHSTQHTAYSIQHTTQQHSSTKGVFLSPLLFDVPYGLAAARYAKHDKGDRGKVHDRAPVEEEVEGGTDFQRGHVGGAVRDVPPVVNLDLEWVCQVWRWDANANGIRGGGRSGRVEW